MPMGMLRLKPGVNVEVTPSQLEAGYSVSNLIRFRNGLAEKLGGWEAYYPFAVGGVPKALHAWQDVNDVEYLAVGSTTALGAISNNVLTNLTPQTLATDFNPNFSTTASSANVTVTDPNISNATTYDSVEFRTPVAVGGLVLSGVYPIDLVLGTTQYRIVATASATTTRANATITAATKANPCSITTSGSHGFSTGDLIYISQVAGMTQLNGSIYTITSTGATTFTIGVNSTGYTTYTSGGVASPSAVPKFTATSGSAVVDVTLQDHGLAAGDDVTFPISTTVGGVTINGTYSVVSISSVDVFTITGNTVASSSTSGFMNTGSTTAQTVTMTIASPCVVSLTSHGFPAGTPVVFTTTGALPTGLTSGSTYYVLASGLTANAFEVSATVGGSAVNTSGSQSGVHTVTPQTTAGMAQLTYYIGLGPVPAYTGYSIGTYSSGGYSTGSTGSSQTGIGITAANWTLDNWGQTLLACPEGGGIYTWEPNTGFQNAKLIGTGPLYNTGMFVSMQTQMVIAYGSTDEHSVGIDYNPLLVKWCAQGDYTSWAISTTSQAGSRQLPTGSKIVGGMSVPGSELLWTDLDLWSMNYLGSLAAGVWGFQKIGSNCGLIGKHAATRQGSNVYWMSDSNFWVTGSGQPAAIPCSVWDTIFQDLNTTYKSKCWAWSNTPYNEIVWYYPRASTSATECDAYVKYNTSENVWDYGPLDRSAGIDQSILGMPIAASSAGIIYEHEVSPDAAGQPLNAYFETGWFQLSDGQDVMFIDWMLPDFIWKTFGSSNPSANVQVTFFSVYYPGDTPQTHGPYTVSQSTKYINPRIRGRLVKFRIESNDIGSFWRTGGCRTRAALDGRL